MKKLIISILFICLLSPVFAENKADLSPLELSDPIYWIFGDIKSQAKLQFAFKYSILKKYDSGLFFNYRQLSFWNIYSQSSPFGDTNYNPEVRIKSKYFFKNKVDYFIISPYEHMSNGRDGEDSRSIDRAYVEVQVSTKTNINFGINIKGFIYYNSGEEYYNYSSFYETKLFISIGESIKENAKDEIYIKFGGYKTGFVEVGYISRKLWFMNPRIYVQAYYGYLESMLHFDRKEMNIRSGVIFK